VLLGSTTVTAGIRLRHLTAAVGAAVCLAQLPLAGQRTAAPTTSVAVPRLLVLLVVDQFRADYVDWYGSQWTGGLHRLRTAGAVFPRATVPYGITKTCAGHASIGTGAYPATHGLIDNDWYDPERRALTPCTFDPTVRAIGLGGASGSETHSAAQLRAPTLGDELRRQARQPPRIVSVALKARAAITLGGRGGPGTIVLWEEDSGAWATSSAFAATPWPEANSFISSRPPTAARSQVWNRLLPPDHYLHTDPAVGEPRTGTFPHPLSPPPGVPFSVIWDMSPWSDAYVADLAGSLADRMDLGQRETTDLLAIGFSALDYVGHSYGPRSHEVQDMLARLDAVIGRLLNTLDRTVGADKYVLALTSDHGVADLPEQVESFTGVEGGRVSLNALGQAIETALGLHYGRRPFIEAITGTYVHFFPGVVDRIRADPSAQAAVTAAAQSVRSIDATYWSWDLASAAPTDDPRLSAMRRSYVVGRSGDLAFQPRVNWVVAGAGTNHGSWHPYDTTVPVMLLGHGIKPGRYTAATIVDIAPTLAALAGIAMPRADGRVLTEALDR
jgi:predicted AlkP superfamily pyrophosphatase or phosphodiesterase